MVLRGVKMGKLYNIYNDKESEKEGGRVYGGQKINGQSLHYSKAHILKHFRATPSLFSKDSS
ncbi:hypothetical protein E2C01_001775 [Portunus trituberculatus]|uniref:Uncharacterized protein n=1 Tax=Portunus trituberculatus TaxID=210409 RepID=A0A5B7CNC6_PORTR|nr:hypothetical protein [Portunus trituberculatus]